MIKADFIQAVSQLKTIHSLNMHIKCIGNFLLAHSSFNGKTMVDHYSHASFSINKRYGINFYLNKKKEKKNENK